MHDTFIRFTSIHDMVFLIPTSRIKEIFQLLDTNVIHVITSDSDIPINHSEYKRIEDQLSSFGLLK